MRPAAKGCRSSARSTRGAIGAAALLLVCCVLVPLAVGVAGFLAVGLELATVGAVAVAIVVVVLERRGGGKGCGSSTHRRVGPR